MPESQSALSKQVLAPQRKDAILFLVYKMQELIKPYQKLHSFSRHWLKIEGRHCMTNAKLAAHMRKNENRLWAPPLPLFGHLEGTARPTPQFTKAFGSSSWVYVAGLAHYEAYMHPNQNKMGGYFLLPVLLKGLHIFIERLGRIGRYHAPVQFLIQSNVYGERGAYWSNVF
ncbi:MAG: hypothetical protein GXY71_10535 [Treponema sp.]|nr:hypothetical protein [Treponema sp.]